MPVVKDVFTKLVQTIHMNEASATKMARNVSHELFCSYEDPCGSLLIMVEAFWLNSFATLLS